MQRITSCFILLAFTFQSLAQQTSAKIDSFLTAYTKTYQFNGTALVAKNGKIILSKGYGYRNASSGTLNDAGSIFQLGSMTKQFTAAVLLKLEEEKKLSLADKL